MLPLPEPRDAQQASRQADVYTRAKTLFGEQDYFWYHCGANIYGVYKHGEKPEDDKAYTINLLANTCTCPYFTENKTVCKHILALHLDLDRIAEEEGLIAQCERIEREYAVCELEAVGCDPFAEF